MKIEDMHLKQPKNEIRYSLGRLLSNLEMNSLRCRFGMKAEVLAYREHLDESQGQGYVVTIGKKADMTPSAQR